MRKEQRPLVCCSYAGHAIGVLKKRCETVLHVQLKYHPHNDQLTRRRRLAFNSSCIRCGGRIERRVLLRTGEICLKIRGQMVFAVAFIKTNTNDGMPRTIQALGNCACSAILRLGAAKKIK